MTISSIRNQVILELTPGEALELGAALISPEYRTSLGTIRRTVLRISDYPPTEVEMEIRVLGSYPP